jgi:glycosyltransferase involved in cell wall biosynthesis
VSITLSYIVPAFNEDEIIGETLVRFTEDFLELSDIIGKYEIIVVDDGSTDRTAAIVQEFANKDSRIRLIRHEKNRGAGEAILTGLANSQMEWFSANSADRPFHLADIRTFAPLFSECDVILVCRTDRNANSWYRKLTSLGNLFLIRLIFRSRFGDFQFVQFYRRKLLVGTPFVSRGTLVPPEMILRSHRLGARIREVSLPFHPRLQGTSKYGHPKHIFVTLFEMAKLRLLFWKENGVRS